MTGIENVRRPSPGTGTVSVKLREDLVHHAKAVALVQGMHISDYLSAILHEYVARDLPGAVDSLTASSREFIKNTPKTTGTKKQAGKEKTN